MDSLEKIAVLTTVLLIKLLRVPGQRCTSGFLDTLSENNGPQTQLVPLLGGKDRQTNEQWIFPNLRFTCQGRLTKWTFRGVKGENFETSCSVDIKTWRQLDRSSSYATEYEQVDATDKNVRRLTFGRDESVFIYELIKPVQVQPGDIVGISKSVLCRSPDNFDNILSLNISWSNSTNISYRRYSGGTQFFLESPFTVIEDDLVPLVMPVFAESSSADPTDGYMPTTEDINQSEDDNQSEDGSSSMVAIAAGISGGIVALVILLAVCVCTVCLSRHVQVHVHYNKKTQQRQKEIVASHDETTSNEVQVQLNVAYSQAFNNRQPNRVNPQQSQWLNQSCWVTQPHELRLGKTEHEKGAHWTLTKNALYQHGSLIQGQAANPREHGHFAVPVVGKLMPQHNQNFLDDDDNTYEYIQ